MINEFSVKITNDVSPKNIKQKIFRMIAYLVVFVMFIIIELKLATSMSQIQTMNKSNKSTITILLFIAGLVFLFISILIIRLISKIFFQKTTDKGKKFRLVNEKVLSALPKYDFKTTKTFYISTSKTGPEKIEQMLLLVDGNQKKLALIDYNKNICKIVSYSDIITYKIQENNSVDINYFSIDILSQVSATDVCKKLKLIIIVNDENNPNIIYDCVPSSITTSSQIYKDLSTTLVELSSFFEVIINKTPKDKKFVYCRFCGVKNDQNSTHCSSCGSALKD